MNPQHLELDVRDGSATDDPEAMQRLLQSVSDLGVSLALDDFGSESSRLGDLRKLPFKRIKIDKPFIEEIGLDGNPGAVARAATVLGHSLGMEVTAEGVEAMDQLSFLHSVGCDSIQGFVFSKPLAATDFQAFYDNVQEGVSPIRVAGRRSR